MRVVIIYALLSLLAGCSSGSQVQSDDLSGGWYYDQPIELDISVLASPRSLQITHSDSYGYQNIYLTIQSDSDYSDTLSVRLASKDGYWLGDRSGSSYTVSHELPGISDVGEVKIAQYSRDSVLYGVERVAMIGQ